MKYKKCISPDVFGFGILIPKKNYSELFKYKEQIKDYADWIAPKSFKGGPMEPHIAIKYLGYHKNYSNAQIKKLISELKEIAKKYLPLEITIRGIKIGTKFENIGVLSNFRPTKKVRDFHKEVIDKLNKKIDIFGNIDGKNFSPHITLASAEKNSKNLQGLRKIAKKSKQDKELKIKCKDLYIYFKGGPVKI